MPCRSIILWPGCWMYLKAPEQEKLTFVLKILKSKKTMSQNYICEKTGIGKDAVRKALDLLLILKCAKVQQRKDARIYSLMKGWRSRLNKALTPYDKNKTEAPPI